MSNRHTIQLKIFSQVRCGGTHTIPAFGTTEVYRLKIPQTKLLQTTRGKLFLGIEFQLVDAGRMEESENCYLANITVVAGVNNNQQVLTLVDQCVGKKAKYVHILNKSPCNILIYV